MWMKVEVKMCYRHAKTFSDESNHDALKTCSKNKIKR